MNPSPGPWTLGPSDEPVPFRAYSSTGAVVAMFAHSDEQQAVDNKTLIALAPEMREMLLAEEWHDIDGDLECPECGTVRRYAESVNPVVYHYPDCKRGALLEKLR